MQDKTASYSRCIARAMASLVLLSPAGCYTYQDPTPVRQEKPKLAVHPVYYSHAVMFDAVDNRPADAEMQRLKGFLARVGSDDKDVLHIRFTDSLIHKTQAQILQALLKDQGYRAVTQPVAGRDGPDEGTDGAVTVAVRKVVVELPDCPNWSDVPGRKYDNTAFSNYGCATVTNLGLMVADPQDLQTGHSTQSWDGNRAASAVQRYHERETEELIRENTLSSGSPSDGSGGE